uniref:Homeobox domain-containing protein n=1 Tax=Macrostomum lignano TaxID=282301 RepID=A0A1I8GKA8_9PLAT
AEATELAETAETAEAEDAEEMMEERRGATAGVSALGRLTEHFRDRNSASRQRLKAARAAAAAARAAAASMPPTDLSADIQQPAQLELEAASGVNNSGSVSGNEDSNCIFAGSSPDLLQSASIVGDKRRRTRVFIDPATEIPKLEAWFAQESHPTSAQFAQFASALNELPFRQKQPRLEAKNVQLWFKNHRAKVKRGRLGPASAASPSSSAGGSATPLQMATAGDTAAATAAAELPT